FQAVDGIRDFHVTGVQTCALPISPMPMLSDSRKASAPRATPETRSLLLKSRTDVISGTPGTISRTDAASACWGRGASSNRHRIAAISAATNEQTTVSAKAL